MPLDFNKINKLATPTFVNGKWFKPKISKMELRTVRTLARIAGVPWQDPPSLQKKIKPITFIPLKGIRHDRRLEQRLAKTKELAQTQIKQWAEQSRTRREVRRAKQPDKHVNFVNFLNPHITDPPIPKSDTTALEKHYDTIARKEAKEAYLDNLTKGYVAPQKKLTSEERLARRKAEKEAKKKAKEEKKEAKEEKKGIKEGKETQENDEAKEDNETKEEKKEAKEGKKEAKEGKETKEEKKEAKEAKKEAKEEKKEANEEKKEAKEGKKEDKKTHNKGIVVTGEDKGTLTQEIEKREAKQKHEERVKKVIEKDDDAPKKIEKEVKEAKPKDPHETKGDRQGLGKKEAKQNKPDD